MFKLKLMPEDKKFFVLFNELSQVLVNIVQAFHDFLQNYTNRQEHINKIYELEQKGNKIDVAFIGHCSYTITSLVKSANSGSHPYSHWVWFNWDRHHDLLFPQKRENDTLCSILSCRNDRECVKTFESVPFVYR